MLTNFIRKKAGHYNIGEMSIVFAILAAVAFFPFFAVGCLLHYAMGVPEGLAFITVAVLWSGSPAKSEFTPAI